MFLSGIFERYPLLLKYNSHPDQNETHSSDSLKVNHQKGYLYHKELAGCQSAGGGTAFIRNVKEDRHI